MTLNIEITSDIYGGNTYSHIGNTTHTYSGRQYMVCPINKTTHKQQHNHFQHKNCNSSKPNRKLIPFFHTSIITYNISTRLQKHHFMITALHNINKTIARGFNQMTPTTTLDPKLTYNTQTSNIATNHFNS